MAVRAKNLPPAPSIDTCGSAELTLYTTSYNKVKITAALFKKQGILRRSTPGKWLKNNL